MKAKETRLTEFLRTSQRLIIPIYQRTYSWTDRECYKLLNDILSSGIDKKVPSHFMGSIVYITEDPTYQVSSKSHLLVIDGQQRLTTIMLLLEILASTLGEKEPVDGFTNVKIREYYMINHLEKGSEYYKLQLTQTDLETLNAIIDGSTMPGEPSDRIIKNHKLIAEWVKNNSAQIKEICLGIEKLMVVDVALLRGADNPQLIFESLNSTGKELTQADLIRNYLLMGLEPDTQTRLYRNYWRPMEKDFGQEAYNLRFDSFMRHYLTLKTGNIPNIGAVYDAFKGYANGKGADYLEIIARDMHRFSSYYCKMALDKETEPRLREAFQDLEELKVDVAYPFLLELYDDYISGILSKDEFLKIVRMTEGYVFRRAICEIPTNSLNKTFATLTRGINKEKYLEGIKARYNLLATYKRYPSDDEFKRDLMRKDLYHTRIKNYWLLRLENENRKEKVQEGEYSVEHIMPQNENLSLEWQRELGQDWKAVQSKYLHTIGNLTLTGYNAEYSDRSYTAKREMQGGFISSPLHLNEYMREVDTWNEIHIERRAEILANKALSIWSYPVLDETVLEQYHAKPTTSNYSIDHYPSLKSGRMAPLFEQLRRQITGLDECVTEEFLKYYVAYKADTNFVDIEPMKDRLRLHINMKYAELNDPQRKCKDTTGLSKVGNGDVEIEIREINDITYAIYLIGQSLDKQINEE